MSDLEEAYRLEYFEEEGFHRTQCAVTGAHFWTRDPDRETCGEPPADPYSFIGDPGFDGAYSLEEMRERFLSFFEAEGHARVDPYPVAANRWRDDVLLTQASIYDFQPLVTSGQTPPPANPLTISQPCIRMQDIENVGKTGRHTMAFEMMAHHAFNVREEATQSYAYSGEVYWKDETVRLCDAFFASMGADLAEITYIEDPWVGGGNAGPAFEVLYRGAELATLVFMMLEVDPAGEYEMKDGRSYSPMDTYIVDTGYGLERWVWVSQGTPTVYEAIYPELIAELKADVGYTLTAAEEELVAAAAIEAGQLDLDTAGAIADARATIAESVGVDATELTALVEPLETIYAIADHARTLAYMFGDEIVPSNVKTGYLARMVIRRMIRLVDELETTIPVATLIDHQAARLGYENRDVIAAIVAAEERKYARTLQRGRRRIDQLAESRAAGGAQITTEELLELYDSHGIQPETVAEIAATHDVDVAVPPDFLSRVAARHTDPTVAEEAETTAAVDVAELPATDRLYYDDPVGVQFEAVVLEVLTTEEAPAVVLDQTLFYPEGGGQPADRGTLTGEDVTAEVQDVQLVDDVIIHRVDRPPEKGEIVQGRLDRQRRRRLMQHHTATHLIGHAARTVVGEHIRQAGAQKHPTYARLDLTHFERLDAETVAAIEATANRLVRDDHVVKQHWRDRHEAEAEFGFDLYQGGIPAGETIRTITVGPDVQACGGTHVERTGEVGAITIERTEAVQDGIERLVFSAGGPAIEAIQTRQAVMAATAATFDVTWEELPATAERFFTEWKERGKQIEALRDELGRLQATQSFEPVTVGAHTAVIEELAAGGDALTAAANAIVEQGHVAVVAAATDGGVEFIVAVPDDVAVAAGGLVGALAPVVGGGGGGPDDFAQGGGPDVDAIGALLVAAEQELTARLG
jgi:alanyl-tRNA synthetase